MGRMSKLLQLGDLRARARERGLPSDRTTWIKYENAGLFEAPARTPSGRRVFPSMKEIDKIIDQVFKK